MDSNHDTESNLGKSEIAATTTGAPHNNGLGRLRDRTWYKSMTRRTATVISTMAILALPIGVAFSSKKYIFAEIPLLRQLGFRLPMNESAVLAVDAAGLTIQSKSASAASLEDFQNAALEQLANLHRTYARWAENNQDLTGSLMIRLRVDKSGNVVDIDALAARLSSADFTRVVLSEIRRWTFPAGGTAPVEITIPLLFVPKGMDASTVVQWERKNRVVEWDGKTAVAILAANRLPTAVVDGNDSPSAPSSGATIREETKQSSAANSKNQIGSKQVLLAFKTTQTVDLREQPRFSAKRVHEVDAETEINVLENKGDWLKVKVGDAGSVGFVRKEFVAPLD